MPILTSDMRRVVREQRLGFVATVCPDGTPNVSPKGTVSDYGDEHLVFADIRSPRTVANLRANPAIEINVVDPIARKGYRFKGFGVVLTEGELYERILAMLRERGTQSPIRSIVLVSVERALPLVSPAYDGGANEDDIRGRWRAYYASLEHDDRSEAPLGE